MNIKTYNLFMILATFLAWLGFFIIISNLDPTQANFVVWLLFYLILFLGLLGLFSLLGFWFRILWQRRRGVPRLMVAESFRQALILATVLIIALWLQAMRVLNWWTMALLVILGTALEFFILAWLKKVDNK
jgi:hypothetical protein